MKRKFANWLVKVALRLDVNAIYQAFDCPSLNVFAKFEHGTNVHQRFVYDAGGDAKCLGGLTALLGFNPFDGLVEVMEQGIVKEGAKQATISTKGDDVFVDGQKVLEGSES